MRRFLEIHQVQSFFRIGNDAREFRRVLAECPNPAECGHVGAARKKSKERTPPIGRNGIGRNGKPAHGRLFYRPEHGNAKASQLY